MADESQVEERVVQVNDPKLSEDANRRLTEAVREVVGSDRVRVPTDRTRVSEGQRPTAPFMQRVTSTSAAVVGMVAVAVCVGLIIVTTTGGNSWWLTALAVVVLAVALAVVTLTIIGLASTAEYPDPNLAALLDEQGMRNPEVRFSELVHEFTPVPDEEHRTVAVEDDPALAAAEQTEAGTPSGGPSTAVGPGS